MLVEIRESLALASWTQLGGEHGGRAPPQYFREWGYNMLCPPHFSLLVLYLMRFQK